MIFRCIWCMHFSSTCANKLPSSSSTKKKKKKTKKNVAWLLPYTIVLFFHMQYTQKILRSQPFCSYLLFMKWSCFQSSLFLSISLSHVGPYSRYFVDTGTVAIPMLLSSFNLNCITDQANRKFAPFAVKESSQNDWRNCSISIKRGIIDYASPAFFKSRM